MKRNGQDVTASVGIESPVDPGEYTILVTAPDRVDWTSTVEVAGAGATVTVEIPELAAAPVTDEHRPDGADTALGRRDPDPRDVIGRDRPAPKSKRKLIGLGIAGAGLVAAGVGIVFGVQASSAWSDAKERCGDDNVCDNQTDFDASTEHTDRAKSKALLSTVFVGVGAAALIGGVVLWLTAPSSSEVAAEGHAALRVAPMVGGDHVGLAFSGGF